MLPGRNGVLPFATFDSKSVISSDWKMTQTADSTRRLSHQSSNGDLYHVNQKENYDSSTKLNELAEVIHNYKEHSSLETEPDNKVHTDIESHFICGLRKESYKPYLVTIVLGAWFFCSFITIMLNKYILTTLDTDPGILGEFQIVMTTVFGLIAMYLPCDLLKKKKDTTNENYSRVTFVKSMLILGLLRFGSVVSSVVAMKNVAISFSETIKSSAPLFTVIIAYLILGEYSGVYINLSLVPIMFGLAICTSNELSFALVGFVSALLNNVIDCTQNVYSKKLLAGDQNYSALELQFYTSIAAMIVQLPFWLFFMDFSDKINGIDRFLVGILLFNSVLFYFQSFTAYLLMSLISPITFSVASTAKRAVLIWFSVLVFGNNVTILSGVGTFFVVVGVFLYHRARHKEAAERMRKLAEKESKLLSI